MAVAAGLQPLGETSPGAYGSSFSSPATSRSWRVATQPHSWQIGPVQDMRCHRTRGRCARHARCTERSGRGA